MSMMQFKVIKYKKVKEMGGGRSLLFISYTPPFSCFISISIYLAYILLYKPKAIKISFVLWGHLHTHNKFLLNIFTLSQK